MISMVPELKNDHQARKALVSSFSNKRNLQESVALICRRLREVAAEGKS
jgi:phosphopantothenate synthetase